MTEPSQAALNAAVMLEVENCIGRLSTRELALRLDQVAASLRMPDFGLSDVEGVIVDYLEACGIQPHEADGEWFFAEEALLSLTALAFAVLEAVRPRATSPAGVAA